LRPDVGGEIGAQAVRVERGEGVPVVVGNAQAVERVAVLEIPERRLARAAERGERNPVLAQRGEAGTGVHRAAQHAAAVFYEQDPIHRVVRREDDVAEGGGGGAAGGRARAGQRRPVEAAVGGAQEEV